MMIDSLALAVPMLIAGPNLVVVVRPAAAVHPAAVPNLLAAVHQAVAPILVVVVVFRLAAVVPILAVEAYLHLA
jgi:hypothetical protein